MLKLLYNQYAMFFLPWFFILTFCGILKPYKIEENLTVQLFYELRLLIKLFSFDSFRCCRKYHSIYLTEKQALSGFQKIKAFQTIQFHVLLKILNINKSTLKLYAFKYTEIKVKVPKYSNQLARSHPSFGKIILLEIPYENIFLQTVISHNQGHMCLQCTAYV